jgi:hypothetical protein
MEEEPCTVILFFDDRSDPDFIETTPKEMINDVKYWLKRWDEKLGRKATGAYIVKSKLDLNPIYSQIKKEQEEYAEDVQRIREHREYERLKKKFEGK